MIIATAQAWLLLVAVGWHLGPATTFSSVDSGNPDPRLACYQVPGKKHHRKLDDKHDMVVAHRTLPCRTPIEVCIPRTGLCARAIVGDRGPYGRHCKSRKAVGSYCSDLDIAPALARALKFNGYEPAMFRVVEPERLAMSSSIEPVLE